MAARLGMLFSAIGGILVLVAAAIAVRGGSVGLGGPDASAGLVAAILVTLGAGLLLTGFGASRDRPWLRLGLGLTGGGLLAFSPSQISIVVDPRQPDQLGSALWVALGAIGALALVVGLIVAAGGALARRT